MLKQRNNLRTSVMFGLIFLILTVSRVTMALTVEKLSFEELVQDAEAIVIGVVDQAESAYGEGEKSHRIFTSYTISPTRVLKGDIAVDKPLKMSFIGGRVGDMAHYYPGVPKLEIGTSYIFFSSRNGEDAIPLAGATQGLFSIVEKANGIEQVVPMQGAHLIASKPLTSSKQAAKVHTENDKETTLEAFIERINALLR